MINHVRKPLVFEDWPALFFLWELRRQITSARDAATKTPHYGPTVRQVLTVKNLRNIWRCAKCRVLGRIKNLSWENERWTLTGEVKSMVVDMWRKYHELKNS